MESCDTVFPVSKFCVFHANVRSLLLSIDDLKVVCYEKSPDVFVVSETWLDPSVGDEVSIPGYAAVRSDRDRHGGGLAVYLKSSIKFQPVSFVVSCHSALESMWLALSGCSLPPSTILGACYRPPSAPRDSIDQFITECQVASARFSHAIICGDLNINLLSNSSSSLGFLDSLSIIGLRQVISEPTIE